MIDSASAGCEREMASWLHGQAFLGPIGVDNSRAFGPWVPGVRTRVDRWWSWGRVSIGGLRRLKLHCMRVLLYRRGSFLIPGLILGFVPGILPLLVWRLEKWVYLVGSALREGLRASKSEANSQEMLVEVDAPDFVTFRASQFGTGDEILEITLKGLTSIED